MLRVPRVRLLFEFSLVCEVSLKERNLNVVYYKSCIKSPRRRLRQAPLSICYDKEYYPCLMMTEYALLGPRLHYCCFQMFDLCRHNETTLLGLFRAIALLAPYSRPTRARAISFPGARSFCSAADRKPACSGEDRAETELLGVGTT